MKSGTHKLKEIGMGMLTEVVKGYKEETKEKCIECDKTAEWVRCTQFAGDHPYCDEHARLEKDFTDEDSYQYWSKL